MRRAAFGESGTVSSDTGQGQGRWLRAAGALLAGASVALAAYASHAGNPATRGNLEIAALFGFGHGIALAALARGTLSRLASAGLAMLLSGTLLFGGALLGKALAGTTSAPAPIGGMLMIGGWLVLAAAALRD